VTLDTDTDTDTATLSALLRGNRRLTDAVQAGTLRLDGHEATAARFLSLFPLPEPAMHASDH
jgi:hypothetical protein